MKMSRASEKWFGMAMAARDLARLLTDEETKAAWRLLAVECEATALAAPVAEGR